MRSSRVLCCLIIFKNFLGQKRVSKAIASSFQYIFIFKSKQEGENFTRLLLHDCFVLLLEFRCHISCLKPKRVAEREGFYILSLIKLLPREVLGGKANTSSLGRWKQKHQV